MIKEIFDPPFMAFMIGGLCAMVWVEVDGPFYVRWMVIIAFFVAMRIILHMVYDE